MKRRESPGRKKPRRSPDSAKMIAINPRVAKDPRESRRRSGVGIRPMVEAAPTCPEMVEIRGSKRWVIGRQTRCPRPSRLDREH